MNLHRYFLLARCFSPVMSILLAGRLLTCIPTPPAVSPPLLSTLDVVVAGGFARGNQAAASQATDIQWLETGMTTSLQQFAPYLGLGAATALAAILILLVWCWALRQRVGQRTQELEQALQALRESRRFLSDLIEHSGAVVFIKDLEGRYELINRKWETVTGLTHDQIIGRTDEVLFPGPIGQQFRANDLEVVEWGKVLEREEFLDDASGRRSFISIKFPVRGEDGQIKGVCGMAAEITERKQAEFQREAALEALAESEEIFRLFMEHSPIYVFFKDEQTRSLRLSKNYEHMLGRPLSDLLGKTMDELFPSDLAKSMMADDLRILREGKQIDVVEELAGRVYQTTKFPIARPGRPTWLAGFTLDITEQTRASEALRQSEDKFSKAFHTSPDSISINRLSDGLYLEINEGFTAITGYTGEDVKGRTALELNLWVSAVDRAHLVQGLQEHGQVTNLEASFRMKDGRIITGLMSARLIEVAGEQCILSITRDITERKRADVAVKESERKMRAIVDAAPFGAHLYELEPDGRLVFKGANQSADQILHVDHGQFIGKTIEEAFPPLVETEIPTAYRRVAATGEGYQLDQIAYDDSGISGAFELHAFQTGPNQMAVFFRDVTERKQMDEALRISLEKYRVLFEAFPLGISIIDSEGKILESNLQAEKLLGLPKQEHERRTYDASEWDMLRPDGTPMPADEYASVRALRENRLIQNVEMGIVKDHSAITWLSVTAAPIPLKGYGVAVAYGDITRSKEIENEVRRLNEDLEQRVAERTRELAEANAQLKELDQLKSKFVSDVSHELRTPIANLKLYIDLLEHGKPDKRPQYITVLQQQVRRVAALVDDILDLSRLERRKEQGPIYRAVALNEVVKQVVLAHQPRAEAGGLRLTYEPAAHLPPVHADANQLAQVVTNLVANALSYTPAGYVRVSTFEDNREVGLSVADSGSGIDAEDLPHIFERFYRGRRVLKNDAPGTGLGLAIVKEIVDLHHGRIEVDSRPGHGTTFRVWLPVIRDA